MAFAGIEPLEPRPGSELEPLLRWLRAGKPSEKRLDFEAGTFLPDGRLDMCKQNLGSEGASRLAESLRPGVVKHLLMGTGGLGDVGAAQVAEYAPVAGIETLYLGCNGISSEGVCNLADNLRSSPSMVSSVWLKRNPLGQYGGEAAAILLDSAKEMTVLDLVNTRLDSVGLRKLVDTLRARVIDGNRIHELYIGGNDFGTDGGGPLFDLVSSGAVEKLYVAAANLGDAGAELVADGLLRAPYGALKVLSLASNGIGPTAVAQVLVNAVSAGVEVCDFGKVRAAGALGATNNRFDIRSATIAANVLSSGPHSLRHLVLSDTGVTSQIAMKLLECAKIAEVPTRYHLGKGIARSVKRQLNELCEVLPSRPSSSEYIRAIKSVYR